MLTKERERFSNTFLFSPTSTYITEIKRVRGKYVCGTGSLDAYVALVSCPDPTLCEGKRGLVNLDRFLGLAGSVRARRHRCTKQTLDLIGQ